MPDALSVLLTSILSDATLRPWFQEWCRRGYVIAEGRRVRYVVSVVEGGMLNIEDVLESEYEPIPGEDFRDLSLNNFDGDWRLCGSRLCFDTEPCYEPKEWRQIRFRRDDVNHFLSLGGNHVSESVERVSDDYYKLPDKPPRGREVQRAYRALLYKYGMQVPKRPMQWLADNLRDPQGAGKFSREAVIRALGKRK